jgi:hypothetical protein
VMGRWPGVLAASRFFVRWLRGAYAYFFYLMVGGRAVEILWAGIVCLGPHFLYS